MNYGMYANQFEVRCGKAAEKILVRAGEVAITFVAGALGQLAGNWIWAKICQKRAEKALEKEKEQEQ